MGCLLFGSEEFFFFQFSLFDGGDKTSYIFLLSWLLSFRVSKQLFIPILLLIVKLPGRLQTHSTHLYALMNMID